MIPPCIKSLDPIESSRNALIELLARKRAYAITCGIVGVILLANSIYRVSQTLSSATRGQQRT
jgi:hypothetical protein